MKKVKPKASTKAIALITRFDTDAQEHGWQKDQGIGRYVDTVRKRYEASEKKLIDYVAKLEFELRTEKEANRCLKIVVDNLEKAKKRAESGDFIE